MGRHERRGRQRRRAGHRDSTDGCSVDEDRPEPLAGHPKYEKIEDLAEGAFGFVQRARNKDTGKDVAIKFLPRGSAINKHVEREIVAHSSFCHPHVVQFHEVFLTDEYLAIAMEFASGGDLFHHLTKKGGLKEDEARWFFQQLILALDYCHKKGVANRDMKLENTLLDGSPNPLLKITDFGFCKSDKESLPKSKVGTPAYTAPEVISSGSYDGKKADIWSCGVMLYVMLYNAYPFEREEDTANNRTDALKMMRRILNMELEIPKHPRVSQEAIDLMLRILVKNPNDRLTIQEIQAHPWYMKGLPANVLDCNEEYLAKDPHATEGYQSVEEIMEVVKAAGAPARRKPLSSVSDGGFYDEVGVPYYADEASGDDDLSLIEEGVDGSAEHCHSVMACGA